MTPEEIQNRIDRLPRPFRWGEYSELWLARLWYRVCDHRRSTGQPLPPDELRPRLADPIGEALHHVQRPQGDPK